MHSHYMRSQVAAGQCSILMDEAVSFPEFREASKDFCNLQRCSHSCSVVQEGLSAGESPLQVLGRHGMNSLSGALPATVQDEQPLPIGSYALRESFRMQDAAKREAERLLICPAS